MARSDTRAPDMPAMTSEVMEISERPRMIGPCNPWTLARL
jgi:hypothetical protein